jgi:hypothetical protein
MSATTAKQARKQARTAVSGRIIEALTEHQVALNQLIAQVNLLTRDMIDVRAELKRMAGQ